MFRLLTTPRWLGYAALTLAAASVMILLGFWQLDRYHQRTAINDRIAAGATATPVPIGDVVGRPTGPAGTAGPPPSEEARWTRVKASGHYDPAHEILVRGRTVEGSVGFEVLTPLVLADGTAVLVDRGWVPPAAGGALVAPAVPAPPAGEVTVDGRLHTPESRGTRPEILTGHLETRRVSAWSIASVLPYPIFDGYIGLDRTGAGLTPVAPEKENALQNGGYVLQWWLFAAGTVFAYFYIARKESRPQVDDDSLDPEPAGSP